MLAPGQGKDYTLAIHFNELVSSKWLVLLYELLVDLPKGEMVPRVGWSSGRIRSTTAGPTPKLQNLYFCDS